MILNCSGYGQNVPKNSRGINQLICLIWITDLKAIFIKKVETKIPKPTTQLLAGFKCNKCSVEWIANNTVLFLIHFIIIKLKFKHYKNSKGLSMFAV